MARHDLLPYASFLNPVSMARHKSKDREQIGRSNGRKGETQGKRGNPSIGNGKQQNPFREKRYPIVVGAREIHHQIKSEPLPSFYGKQRRKGTLTSVILFPVTENGDSNSVRK
ncbi:hypothetical protein ACLOJK_016370 [Asimina triloba]